MCTDKIRSIVSRRMLCCRDVSYNMLQQEKGQLTALINCHITSYYYHSCMLTCHSRKSTHTEMKYDISGSAALVFILFITTLYTIPSIVNVKEVKC